MTCTDGSGARDMRGRSEGRTRRDVGAEAAGRRRLEPLRLVGYRHGVSDEIEPRSCTIWLCSAGTRTECLERSLFGDAEGTDRWLEPCGQGDLAFLLDFERDELIGVFATCSGMGINLVPEAWGGHYPCQVRVEALGGRVTLPRAASILKAAGIPLRRLKGGGMAPRGFNFPTTAAVALLRSFAAAGG